MPDKIIKFMIAARTNSFATGEILSRHNNNNGFTSSGCPHCQINGISDTLMHRLNGCNQAQAFTIKRHDMIVNKLAEELRKRFPTFSVRTGASIRDDAGLSVTLPGDSAPKKPDIVAIGPARVEIVEVTCPYDSPSNGSTKMEDRYNAKLQKYETLRRHCEGIFYGRTVNLSVVVVSSLGIIHKKSMDKMKKLLDLKKGARARLERYLSNAALIGSFHCFHHTENNGNPDDDQDMNAEEH